MATTQNTAASEAFDKQLGRMYGTYAGGFIGFVIFLAILEQMGVPNKVLGYLFVFFTLAVYAVIGVMTRTARASHLQRHGDRRGLDVGGLFRRHGRHAVPARL